MSAKQICNCFTHADVRMSVKADEGAFVFDNRTAGYVQSRRLNLRSAMHVNGGLSPVVPVHIRCQ